ncbi:ATP-binding protein [Streptomyces sp. NA04227]|uniref:ATP-binding protein n=1 Tax=Streptomyces sp. NA04227 TaxID=2742136 RepID=UPI001591780F|nr:ATP-binding protein [Streptomyces sp. NA04227]QKW07242.1 ATP-binding protein [Streptomyces sp. NA04227]
MKPTVEWIPRVDQVTTCGLGGTTALVVSARLPRNWRAPRLRCTLDAEPVAARTARHLVRACFAGRLSANVVADACLVLTELVTNAVTAIGSCGAVEFGAWVAADGAVVVQVIDQAVGEPRKRYEEVHDGHEDVLGGHEETCDGDAESGRGLLLVETLTQDWGWHPVPGGKAVWGLVPAAGSGRSAVPELSNSPLSTVP